MAGLKPEFEKRNCKVLGISVDGVSDPQEVVEGNRGIPGTRDQLSAESGDPELKVVKLYDMLPADEGDTSTGRTAADNATARSVFIIGPDKKIKATLTYPMSTGRNFDEILRLLDSCQLTATHKVATPVNWKQGNDVIIVPAVSRRRGQEEVSCRLAVAATLHPDRSPTEVAEALYSSRSGVVPVDAPG